MYTSLEQYTDYPGAPVNRRDRWLFLSTMLGIQLELLNLFLKPQVDQCMGRDASFLSGPTDGFRQSFLDGIQRFLRFKVHIYSDGTRLAPIIGQIVLIPEIGYSGVGSCLGDTALTARNFTSTSLGSFSATFFHNVFFLRLSYHEPSIVKYDGLICK